MPEIAALVEQSAAASESLKDQARRREQAVAAFKVRAHASVWTGRAAGPFWGLASPTAADSVDAAVRLAGMTPAATAPGYRTTVAALSAGQIVCRAVLARAAAALARRTPRRGPR